MHLAPYTASVYAGCSTTARIHQDLCQKIQKQSQVSISRQEIFDPWPSIYLKRSKSALQSHFEGYKSTISSYGKEEKAFNFESKVTLEKLIHIEFASLCPSSLNTLFSPQALSLLSRGPHYLFAMSLPLVEDLSGRDPAGRNLVSWFRSMPTRKSVMLSLLLINY